METQHGDAATARRVANAVRPDNTAEMETTVEGDRIVTRIDRGTTGGLRTTVDDYVVNLQTAAQLATTDGAASTDTHDT
ncbi:KEOPS complex Pcc1-like subunit [Halobacteriales archaeon SW_7_65_23]|nr:MAG: KEOPS complex Pcc1-like subunit [Halobacteriales archaeon SW_7_65_23]